MNIESESKRIQDLIAAVAESAMVKVETPENAKLVFSPSFGLVNNKKPDAHPIDVYPSDLCDGIGGGDD